MLSHIMVTVPYSRYFPILEYEVYERGSDLSICTRTTAQELGNEKITELPVYRLISDLTKSDDGEAEHTQEFSRR